jgi:hypothetical protein
VCPAEQVSAPASAVGLWLAWDPGERELYLRRSWVLVGGVGSAFSIGIILVLALGPSPPLVLELGLAGIAAIWSALAALRYTLGFPMPDGIQLSEEGMLVRRGKRVQLVSWTHFRPRILPGIWFIGHARVDYRRGKLQGSGTLWVSRAMIEGLLSRRETSGWKTPEKLRANEAGKG